jgi:hypothetical protein
MSEREGEREGGLEKGNEEEDILVRKRLRFAFLLYQGHLAFNLYSFIFKK